MVRLALGVTVSTTRSGNIVTIRLIGSAGNPFRHVPVIENTIDYEFEFVIDFTDMNNPTFVMSGRHDGFPNYEVYVNEQQVHAFAHSTQTPFSLFPPMEWIVAPISGRLRP